jgi:ArsR family transcriptional regulator, arsenate/arsenite/antimonite-responsive transcriptional repressor
VIEIFKALGDENRLRILNILMGYELCVCELEVLLEMTQSNVSRHLGKLKSNGLITASKDAQWVHYKLSDTFDDENELLIRYLELNFNKSSLFKKDLSRCTAYKNSEYDCQTIRSDKNLVLKFLENAQL